MQPLLHTAVEKALGFSSRHCPPKTQNTSTPTHMNFTFTGYLETNKY